MNKAELVTHVASEASVTRATAERMVATVFSAIADALVREDPVAIAGFGRFAVRSRAARQGRNPEPGSRSPSRRRRCRRSSPARPCAMRSIGGPRDVWGREGLGANLEIRHTCERLRRPAADIGSLARGCLYMASRRIAPTTALRASARG